MKMKNEKTKKWKKFEKKMKMNKAKEEKGFLCREVMQVNLRGTDQTHRQRSDACVPTWLCRGTVQPCWKQSNTRDKTKALMTILVMHQYAPPTPIETTKLT